MFNKSLITHAKKLYPICRSITGDGIKKTLSYFEQINTDFQRERFASGTKVFDWEIPKVWNISDAYIEHLDSGMKFANFLDCNLHVVGYSKPVEFEMDLSELKEKIFTRPDKPNWIPYVTSYYKRDWGFCMSEKQKNALPKGKYKVKILSSFTDDYLELSHALLKGEKRNEIFFSSYVCHPSMVNNELSGPIVMNALLEYVRINYPNPKFSYRFVMLPETIGSIAYLSRFLNEMKENIICGFNLSCVGDEKAYSHLQSPYADTLADKALSSALLGLDNVKTYSFLERGSDERQYCSPGIELPVCTFCRSKFGEYEEYHTNADNFSVVTENGLQGSLNIIKTIVDAFELGLYPLIQTKCEPHLGKRGLYPTISHTTGDIHPAKILTNILTYCNGKNTIFDICELTDLNLKEVLDQMKIIYEKNLLIDYFDFH